MLLFWFTVTVVLLILLISKLKIHAFLSLIIAGLLFGIAVGLNPVDVATSIAAGFGGTMQSIGIVIVLGVLIGQILEVTGGAQKIADSILKVVGIKRATYATSLTGGVISIPVFCDSGYIILNPVIKAMSRSGNIPFATLVVALMSSLLTTHAFVPPTPGPVAAAAIYGADLGKVMLYGLIVSCAVLVVCSIWANSRFIKGKYPEIATIDTDVLEKEKEFQEVVAKAPSTFKSYVPIVVPIILIVAASFIKMENTPGRIIAFLGTPWIALFIGTILAFTLPSKINATVTDAWVSDSMKGAAEILLITAAAGGFAKVLQSTALGETLSSMIVNLGLPVILIPFLMSTLLCVALGSTTVALMTVGAVMAPIIGSLGLSPEMAVLATAAGSIACCHTNSSYFWCVSKLAGFDLAKSYRTITLTTFIMGTTALATTFVLSLFIR